MEGKQKMYDIILRTLYDVQYTTKNVRHYTTYIIRRTIYDKKCTTLYHVQCTSYNVVAE